ncbi:sigma factor-like helix-turn-helix DNA-binding protein [Kineococcus rhizosphaerae]|uniref:DNA-directed RNA polymerase specialized sigma24 family protein n=1 Tax=Kineococcus rhizosphaerae TaxID=559628 RepID=A0A2T0R216_9ACTN|nr:sigma factor-like helix-turn-helix DNA-binding protein [Kineococcus rhizosphaerae]PRY13609.1 DNA-directed RNA polymerase specialized sigma24 family protein [Kineococcus rhizosphaerae]
MRGAALQRLARALLRDPAEADDVVQDVLARVLLAWPRISRSPDPAAEVDRRLVLATTRHRRGSRSTRAGTPGPLGVLPVRQRAVLALRYVDDQSDERIADVLDTSVEQVRAAAERGLAALRRRTAAAG